MRKDALKYENNDDIKYQFDKLKDQRLLLSTESKYLKD
jgi:hypothetical protein